MFRTDYENFCKTLVKTCNELLEENLFGAYEIKFVCKDHFIDRLQDREVSFDDLAKIASLLKGAIIHKITDLLYGMHLPDALRIEFQHGQLVVGATVNPQRNRLILRTIVLDRVYEGKHSKFSIRLKDTK